MANKNAKKALEQFKNEAANEVGVTLNQGYNGDLTSRQAGSIGGQMVKKICTVRNAKTVCTARYIRKDRTAAGHEVEVRYAVEIVI